MFLNIFEIMFKGYSYYRMLAAFPVLHDTFLSLSYAQ